MPPFRAQGLASGLHDGSNICWKIASVLLGQSHQQLLDSYQIERLPNVRAAIAAAEGMGSMICLRRPKLLWHLKNHAFALVNAAGLFDLVFHHFTPSVSISYGLISGAPSAAAAAVGSPVPNLRTSCCNAAPQLCFDEVFWNARGGKLRWCLILTANVGGEQEQSEVKQDHCFSSYSEETFVVVRCHCSSDMAMWLKRFRSTAAVVRYAPFCSFALVLSRFSTPLHSHLATLFLIHLNTPNLNPAAQTLLSLVCTKTVPRLSIVRRCWCRRCPKVCSARGEAVAAHWSQLRYCLCCWLWAACTACW